MALEFTATEREFLVHVLRERLGELKEQVHHATISKFIDRLKAEEQLVNDLIVRFSAAESAASSATEPP